MTCRHYIVEGQVQGVFFRVSTRDQANQLGLKGWVRNCADGSVELVACGEESVLNELEQWLHQGPPMARVEQVTVSGWQEAMNFDGFEVI
jgi:acylphosphatase